MKSDKTLKLLYNVFTNYLNNQTDLGLKSFDNEYSKFKRLNPDLFDEKYLSVFSEYRIILIIKCIEFKKLALNEDFYFNLNENESIDNLLLELKSEVKIK